MRGSISKQLFLLFWRCLPSLPLQPLRFPSQYEAENPQPPLRRSLLKAAPRAGSVNDGEGMKSTLRFSVWKATLFSNPCVELIYRPHPDLPHHHPPSSLTFSAPGNLWKSQAVFLSSLHEAVQVIFCQVPVGFRDSHGGICNTSLFLDLMFCFCSSSFTLALGESSAFSLMLSYQLNTLFPKGCVGVLLNDLGNSLC